MPRRLTNRIPPSHSRVDGFIHTTHAPDEVAAAGNRYYRDDPRPYLAIGIDLPPRRRAMAVRWRRTFSACLRLPEPRRGDRRTTRTAPNRWDVPSTVLKRRIAR